MSNEINRAISGPQPRAGPDGQQIRPVIVVGAGPVGTTAALLLADAGIPVVMLERHAAPHPLPRAVHLDDEVARILYQAGVGDDFLASSRPCSGLRLLDARHQVMAEFGRAAAGVHGFPQANMFHQPDLEQLLLGRVAAHPLITLHRTAEVIGLDDPAGTVVSPCSPDSPAVTVTARTGPARPAARVRRLPGPGLRRRREHDPGPGWPDYGGPRLHRALARHRHPGRRRAGGLGRRRAGLRPRQGRDVHAGHRRPVPVGVPAARRRGRGRPDHRARARRSAAPVDAPR